MKLKNFIKEQQRNKLLENSGINIVQGANLISIDIQPEYENYIKFNLNSFILFFNCLKA